MPVPTTATVSRARSQSTKVPRRADASRRVYRRHARLHVDGVTPYARRDSGLPQCDQAE